MRSRPRPIEYTWDTLTRQSTTPAPEALTDVSTCWVQPAMGGQGSCNRSPVCTDRHHVVAQGTTEDYVDFVREVANRHKGRITAYQIWNEANTRSFYEGDWTALAKLTRRAHDAIKLMDPSAQVVGVQHGDPGRLFQTESFFVRCAALHKARRTR